MNRLSNEDRQRVVACLVEGNSIRSTVRITGIAKKTVQRLGVELGEACKRFADRVMRDLPCRRIQCDEIWSFCRVKDKNATPEGKLKGEGDVWTWVAIDPETKLIPVWHVADRTAVSAYKFMRNLSGRLAHRVQLTTDGHRAYLVAVEAAFAFKPIDFAQVIKIYGNNDGAGRYSPAGFVGETITVVSGNPDRELISTSHAERQNLTMRMQMRRFTRLTNGFSKKIENHRLACAVHFIHCAASLHASRHSGDGRWTDRSRLESRGDRKTFGSAGGVASCCVSRSASRTTENASAFESDGIFFRTTKSYSQFFRYESSFSK